MNLISLLGSGLVFLFTCSAAQEKFTFQDTIPPQDFVPVEKEPVVVKKVDPKYPELALRAGIEGVVWVKIWITSDGKPKDVQIMKTDNHVFDQSAIDAAKQFVFTPAMKDGKPISVWVSVPFKFKLWREPDEMKQYAKDLRSKIDRPTVIVVRGPKGLKNLIKYPRQAVKQKIEGAVFASVTLSDSLTILGIKVTQGLEKNCDRAVLVGLSSFDYSAEKEMAVTQKEGSVSIVVQFILPSKK
jgi:TonB family protein